MMKKDEKHDMWVVYDGECPFCKIGSDFYKVRESVGDLHMIDARVEKKHPLINEINEANLDLDQGVVIKYGGELYYKDDALTLMAKLGGSGLFNVINGVLFRFGFVSKVFYPLCLSLRKVALTIKNVGKIHNLEKFKIGNDPIFKPVFGDDWEDLPIVLRKYYSFRPYSNDVVRLEGVLDVEMSRFMKLMGPLFTFLHILMPCEGVDVPANVNARASLGGREHSLERHLYFPNRKMHSFYTRMIHLKDGSIFELIKFGLGWRSNYVFEDGRMNLVHEGYYWRVFGALIPIPLVLFLGKAYAYEEAISDDEFRMCVAIINPLFGKVLEYKGKFRVL